MTAASALFEPEAEAADALALAERVVEAATRAGATEAETLVVSGDSALTRFANSQIHQNVSETGAYINLRFVVGKRVAVASSGRTDDEGIRGLVERAAAIARHVQELDDWGGLPEPGQADADPAAFSAGTASATPELRAEGARAVIAASDAARATAFGSFKTEVEATAVANSRGIRSAEARTSSQLLAVLVAADGGSGYAEACAVDATTIDGAAIGREAAEKARASGSAVAIDPGEYPVVLEPYAVVDLLDMCGYLGFSALAVQEGRSFFENGRPIGSKLVTIVDDGHDHAGVPMSFDYEGVPKQRVTLVEAGVCRELVYDQQTAARGGVRSTGHGLPAPNTYGPFPINMSMAAGDATREELIGALDRGLLVTRFHYTNPVHPKRAIVTGMTRDGTFLVEGGTIVKPVRNLRFTQSYLDALHGVQAVGRDRKTIKGFLGASVVPAVRIDAWTFTGATEP